LCKDSHVTVTKPRRNFGKIDVQSNGLVYQVMLINCL